MCISIQTVQRIIHHILVYPLRSDTCLHFVIFFQAFKKKKKGNNILQMMLGSPVVPFPPVSLTSPEAATLRNLTVLSHTFQTHRNVYE